MLAPTADAPRGAASVANQLPAASADASATQVRAKADESVGQIPTGRSPPSPASGSGAAAGSVVLGSAVAFGSGGTVVGAVVDDSGRRRESQCHYESLDVTEEAVEAPTSRRLSRPFKDWQQRPPSSSGSWIANRLSFGKRGQGQQAAGADDMAVGTGRGRTESLNSPLAQVHQASHGATSDGGGGAAGGSDPATTAAARPRSWHNTQRRWRASVASSYRSVEPSQLLERCPCCKRCLQKCSPLRIISVTVFVIMFIAATLSISFPAVRAVVFVFVKWVQVRLLCWAGAPLCKQRTAHYKLLTLLFFHFFQKHEVLGAFVYTGVFAIGAILCFPEIV